MPRLRYGRPPPAQRRLAEIATDIHAVDSGKGSSEATLSTASRLDFWSKAVEFIEQAPLFGHGTGSTKSLYQSLEATRPSPYGEAVPDPHNQFFAIAIQVGLVGGAILLAMWAVHFSMFVGGGFACAHGAGGGDTKLHRVAFQQSPVDRHAGHAVLPGGRVAWRHRAAGAWPQRDR